MHFGGLYDYPIWVVGVWFVVVLHAALEFGYRMGLRQRDKWTDTESGGGNLVITSMFALLGLILAFTYAAGVNRNETRKQAVIAEANALGTAFLRAGLVAEPGRTELREALLDYARTRPLEQGRVFSEAERGEILRTTLQAQAPLWPITERIVRRGGGGPIEAALVAAITDVLDVHAVRIAAAFDKLPRPVVWLLLLIAASALAVSGFNAGISGRMSRGRMYALAVVVSAVMLVIADFDRPYDGFIRVSQASIGSAIAAMEARLGS